MLARDVWKETRRATPIDNVIDVQMTRLRRKVDPNGGRLELYDLATDVSEQHNAAADNPQITTRLQTALRHWYASLPPIKARQ